MLSWFDKRKDPAKVIAEIQAKKSITKKQAEMIVRRDMPSEGKFQSKIKEAIQNTYPQAFVVKIAQGAYSSGGIPDILAIIDGNIFWFEVKKPYFGEISDLQRRIKMEIEKAGGGIVSFISYAEEALEIINNHLSRR